MLTTKYFEKGKIKIMFAIKHDFFCSNFKLVGVHTQPF